MNWTTLVSVEALRAALDEPDLRLADCRYLNGDDEAGQRAWRAGHLPRAGFADLNRELSDLGKPAALGRHPLPEAADFCAVLERLGISPDSQVVAYDWADGSMAAARLWWLLRVLGHRRVAVLDGGIAAWQAQDLPVETAVPLSAPGRYSGQFDASHWLDTAALASELAEGRVCLLDARAAERFRGEVEPLDPVAGHIPGARCRPLSSNLRDGRFKPADELRREFERQTAPFAPSRVVLSCGSGVTACHNLLAMEHAGLHGARIFPASWSGWVSDPSRPVATGE